MLVVAEAITPSRGVDPKVGPISVFEFRSRFNGMSKKPKDSGTPASRAPDESKKGGQDNEI
jgi:hypothetical protein